MRCLHIALVLALGYAATAVASSDPYDEKFARKALAFAFAAYDRSGSEAWTCEYCKHNAGFHYVSRLFVKEQDEYGFVGFDKTNKTIWVSFEGSENTPNWIADFEFQKMRDYPLIPGAHVHHGFYETYMGMQDQLRAAVVKILGPNGLCPTCTEMITTGHSLGAAVSGMAAVDMALFVNGSVTVKMWNFGMPRVGDETFTVGFKKLITTAYRTVHQNDIVPHLPFRWLDYRHVATEVWDKDSDPTHPSPKAQTYVVCDGSGEDPKCSDSVPPEDLSAEQHVSYMGCHDNTDRGCFEM